ncbi:MAG: hypothetical protein J0I84_05145 [Terrimonas sp.]|nr:hypothetical protein [Terrimonas sp.]OJY97972.1 MAG: hypothetical protein BGP13_09920 [Sphingobacteriales bacterium 40-81]
MATTSKVRENRRNIRQATRCSNRTTKPVESSSNGANNNGFLNHLFKPMYNVPAKNWRHTEREFFYSLSNLCQLYGWIVPDVSHLDYPLNVSTAFAHVKTMCEQQNLNCTITKSERNTTSITTIKTFDTGHTLYYIPVRPVWQLLQNQSKPVLTEIWLMLFRYLYHINGVTYYRQGCYLDRIYDILQNWIEDECDSEDEAWRNEQLETMEMLQTGGDLIYTYLRQDFSAKQLQKLQRRYRKSRYYDVEMESIAKKCLRLWKDYPTRSIGESMVSGLTPNNYGEIIFLDHYLSFFWSANDCLYDSLMGMVNDELMEMHSQEQPVSLQCFDKPQVKQQHSLDFETRFFALVEDMSEALDRLEKAQS